MARTREGAVPHPRSRRSLERLAAGSSRGRGRPGRRLAGAAAPRLEEGQPVVGRDVERHPGSRSGARDARSCSPRVEPGDSHPAQGARSDGRLRRSFPDSPGERTSRSGAGRRATRPTCASRSCTTRPAATTTRGRRRAAIVKGIQLFHVQGNGWNDIGYNFLVDRFGTIYEGRFGGVDRNVIGAHALGFNTGSVGIALLGTYGNTAPSPAAQDAIARLIAWRLDLAHVDPTSFLTYISGGSERYKSGIPVLLSAVSGHRDTGFTECPGNALYARLGAIAATARDVGGLKIFEPKAEASGSSIRVLARLSRPQAMDGRRSRARPAPRWHVVRGQAQPSTGPGSRPARPRAPTRGRWRRGARARRWALSARVEVQLPLRSRVSPPSPRRSARTATGRRTRPPSPTGSLRPRTSRWRSPTRSGASSRRSSIACGLGPDSTR